MSNNSVQQLSEKLRQKQQEDRQQVEILIQSELTKLTQNFSRKLNDVLNTTLSATQQSLQSVSGQTRQLQAGYQENKQEMKSSLSNYLIISGLLHFMAVFALAGALFWFIQPLRQITLLNTKPLVTQGEKQQQDTLLNHGVQVIHNRHGEGFLLFPLGVEQPQGIQHPSFQGQWLLRLPANPATQR